MVKNSLKSPPPSIPDSSWPHLDPSASVPAHESTHSLVDERDLDGPLECWTEAVQLPKPILRKTRPVYRRLVAVPPSGRIPLQSEPSPIGPDAVSLCQSNLCKARRLHSLDELPEDLEPSLEGDSHREVIEQTESRGDVRHLPLCPALSCSSVPWEIAGVHHLAILVFGIGQRQLGILKPIDNQSGAQYSSTWPTKWNRRKPLTLPLRRIPEGPFGWT